MTPGRRSGEDSAITTQRLRRTLTGEPPPTTVDRGAAGVPVAPPTTTPEQAAGPLVPLGLDWLAIALAVALFLRLAAHQWHLPGLYNDEAYDVVPAMQLLLGQPVALNRGTGLHLLGRDLPLMISDYQGVSSMYVALPIFALFGAGVGAVRGMTIGFGVVALVLTYLLGRRLYGRPAGLVAALFLATSPSFVFWSRVGVYVVSQVVPLALGAMLCALRWRDTGRARWLALAGLLAGIGLSTKILFMWFILGAAGAGFAVWLVDWRWPLDARGRPARRQRLRRRLATIPAPPARPLLGALGGLLLGAAPLIAYNLGSAGTFKVVRANLGQTEKGADNGAFVANLIGRLGALRTVLEGSYFWFLGGVEANRLVLPLFLLSAAGLLRLVCAHPDARRHRDATVFLLTMILAVLVQSSFTLSGLEATHLLLILPLPLLLIGGAGQLVGAWAVAWRPRGGASRQGRIIRTALPTLLLVAPIVAGNLIADARYHAALAQTGGRDSFSDRIYDLARFLDAPKLDSFNYRHPYALDWGMKYNIELLTAGRVQPQEIYGQGRDVPADFDTTLDRLFADRNNVYLAHRAEGDNIPAAYPNRTLAFFRHAEERGKRVFIVRTVVDHTGTPLFYVYSVRDG